jgi:hypothetical protein
MYRTIVTTAGVAVLAAAFAVAVAAAPGPSTAADRGPQTAPGDPLDPRTYAPKSRLFLVAHATGVQKYVCQANGAWLFVAPEATLFKTTGAPTPIGAHYLNTATGRPVWQAKDGSSVEAARAASRPVGSADVPWLLLQAVVTTTGADGDRLAGTTWVQRLNTAGGVAPSGACTPGAAADVPYTADYFFWRG